MGLFSLIFWGLLALFVLLLIVGTITLHYHAEYFKQHNTPYIGVGLSRVIPFFVGHADIVKFEKEIYKEATKCRAPLVGMSDFFGIKNFYICDLDLIKNIFVKDFDHFVNRRPIPETGNTYFKKMVFSVDNEVWKALRARLSPAFTTGRIRRMFQIFESSSTRMETYLKKQMDYPAKKSMDLDFLKIFPKYAMDVIASCCFGVDSKSYEVSPDKMSTFEEMAQKFGFKFSPKFFAVFLVMNLAPRLATYLKLDVMNTESQNYFAGIIKKVMKQRREKGERREDFLQLMMDAQEGLLKADEETTQVMLGSNDGDQMKSSESGLTTGDMKAKGKFNDDDIIANALLFLMAGFDPTQSTLLMVLYAIALEPEVQEKLHREVIMIRSKNGGKLTYEAVAEMKYLDLVINESMRRYTSATRTERVCTKDYLVPGTNVVIEKGSIVILPVLGIMQDSSYFSDAETFLPERFTPENKTSQNPYAFMPFGHGPRNCIGMRFALVKVKTVIAHLVASFKFEPCSKTKIPMEFDRHPNVKPKHGMWLNVSVREITGI